MRLEIYEALLIGYIAFVPLLMLNLMQFFLLILPASSSYLVWSSATKVSSLPYIVLSSHLAKSSTMEVTTNAKYWPYSILHH